MSDLQYIDVEATDPLRDEKDHKVSGGAIITLIGTVISGSMGLASAVLLANARNYLKPKGEKRLLGLAPSTSL